MASFWFYFLISIGSIFAGIIGIGIIYLFFSWLRGIRLKKRIPSTKEEMESGAKIEINKKEVEDDKRRNFEKFREFEKLRRLGTKIEGSFPRSSEISGNGGTPERKDLPIYDGSDKSKTVGGSGEKVKLHSLDD